jgi:hypothetical protein
VQSRFAVPSPGGLFWPGPYHIEFPLPWHLAAGETLQLRIRSSAGGAATVTMAANLWRLP